VMRRSSLSRPSYRLLDAQRLHPSTLSGSIYPPV
jgi:hypothetical protein